MFCFQSLHNISLLLPALHSLTRIIPQALCGSENLKLIGIVTTVNNGIQRAGVARQWLRVLGVHDDSVTILPFSDSNSAACQLPPGFVTCDDPVAMAVGQESDTPRALLELVCR